MKLTSSQIKKLNKLSKKKPIMVRVNQNWYTWAEGDPKYGVFLTTQSGDDVEFDFKQIDDIQENKTVKMKSKLREIIKEELNEVFGQMTIGDLRYHLKKSSLDNPVWVEVRGNAYMIKGVRIDKKRNMTFIQVQ